MRNDERDAVGALLGCVFACLIAAFNFWAGGVSVQYLLGGLGPFVVHHAVAVGFWPCALVGLFAAEITVPAAIVLWVLKLAGIL